MLLPLPAAPSHIRSGAIDSCHLCSCVGLPKEQRARSSRLTGVRLNVREQKETAGEMAVGEFGGGVGGVARDGACCWFC